MPKTNKHTTGIKLIFLCLLATIFIGSFTLPLEVKADEEDDYEHPGYFPLPAPEDSRTGKIDVPVLEGGTGIEKAQNLARKIFENIKLILGTVAFAMLVLSGFQLVIAQGNEEKVTQQKTNLQWWAIGLVVILLMDPLLQIFRMSYGGIFADPNELPSRGKFFDDATKIVITYIKYIIWAIAILFIVRAAYQLILFGDEEETVTKSKKNIIYATIGLVLITLANVYVNKILFVVDKPTGGFTFNTSSGVDPGVDAPRGLAEIVGLTNFLVTFAGPIGILLLIIGAVLYITAQGEEEQMNKAKALIKNTIIGLIIIYGAFALVTTFIAGSI